MSGPVELETIAENEAVRVVGYRGGNQTPDGGGGYSGGNHADTLIIARDDRELVVLDRDYLGGETFEAAAERHVPTDLLGKVLAWLTPRD